MDNNDTLFLICKELDFRDLVSLYKTGIKKDFFKKDIIWKYYLETFELNRFDNLVEKDSRKICKIIYDIFNFRKLKVYNFADKFIYMIYNSSELYLDYRMFKEIPKEIFSLLNLKRLYLNHNYIEEISKEIKKLTNLEILQLEDNKIKKIPKELGKLTNLRQLHLDTNKIKNVPKELGNLTKLQFLYLHYNEIETIPKELEKLTNLNVLTLTGNNSIKKIPENLENLPIIFKINI